MKDYLKRLARGIFKYDDVTISMDDSLIQTDICENSVTDMSFSFKAGEQIKGIIWSSNERVILKDNMFSGTEISMEYQVDSTGMYDGDVLAGTFDIVSSAGEYQLAYEFKCIVKPYDTVDGSIGTLYEFTNLVQKQPEEAARVYRDERFKDTMLRGDDTLKSLYDILAMNISEPEAIEELLVAAHQKEPVKLSIDSDINRCLSKEDDGHSLIINRSTWGYTDIDVSVDAPFILTDTDNVKGEDFTGSMYEMDYLIRKAAFHGGTNYGSIRLDTFNQSLRHDIYVTEHNERENSNRHHRAIIIEITRCYLDYRMKKISSGEWLERTNKLIERLRGVGEDTPYYKLIQAQVMISMGQTDECGWLLDSARSEITPDNVILYCYYLYVSSLAKRDASYTQQASRIILGFYENGYDDWRILWFLFYIDKQFNHNQSVKLTRIKDIYQAGCCSPVMYYEAVRILNSQPVLLRVLNRFEIQVLLFGCRNGIIEEPLARQTAELIAAERVASVKMLEIMKQIYAAYETDENLNVLCSQMIRNGLYGSDCLEIYKKAVLRGLRITRLYEYYIKSLDRSTYVQLPKMVLMFFAYDSGLDNRDKAYLYADVLTNESGNVEIMDSYRPHIEQFGYEQLKQGNVDDNLVVIYKHIWNERLVDEFSAGFMLKLMFMYRVRIYSDSIDNVIVKHKEIRQVDKYPVRDGMAFVPMYTKGCSIAFEDSKGHFHKDTIEYEKEKVLEDASLMDRLLAVRVNDEYFNFYRFEAGTAIGQSSDDILETAIGLKGLSNVEPETKKTLNSWIIQYYNSFYEGDDFAECLKNIDRAELDATDAVRLTESCIRHDLFTDAKSLIEQYGYSGISAELLFRYARHEIEILGNTPEQNLVDITFIVFAAKKYNEQILTFMSEFFNGTNEQMYELWRACENFGVDNTELSERMIAQALFTGEHNGRLTEVFTAYYAKGGSRLIVDAYIAYNSFLYFVKHKKANEIVFTAICDKLERDREVQDICKLALLKYWSFKPSELTEKQCETVSRLLGELCKENKCFEFFKNYRDVVALPYNMLDQTIVEYYGNPQAKVSVHYRMAGSDEEYTELMTVCGGVFVKSFTCFYGESLSYYFTEEYKNKTKQSQVYNLTCSSINTEGNSGRFDYINDMLASRELHDITTMRKLMHGYSVQDYVTRQYFKPL